MAVAPDLRLGIAAADERIVGGDAAVVVQAQDLAGVRVQVLRRMRRAYTVERYRDLIDRLRASVPAVTIATDIIVGFPGETEEQFENTLRLVEEVRFDVVHGAMYSPRPGTLSATWPDDVPPGEKLRRHKALEALQQRIASEINGRLVGSEQEILRRMAEAADAGEQFDTAGEEEHASAFRLALFLAAHAKAAAERA